MSMDDIEIWFDKGVTDGLPVVPPTRERVTLMLAGTARDRAELVGEVAPNYGRATVEKVAVNAVMAGCRPDYLPVVIAGVATWGFLDEGDMHTIRRLSHQLFEGVWCVNFSTFKSPKLLL